MVSLFLNIVYPFDTRFYNLGYDMTYQIPTLVNNYKGPNLSGAEFNAGANKKYGHDYIYPNTTQLDYYASKGFGIICMPFDLTRVYPIPYLPLTREHT